MKRLIIILVIAAICYGGYVLYNNYFKFEEFKNNNELINIVNLGLDEAVKINALSHIDGGQKTIDNKDNQRLTEIIKTLEIKPKLTTENRTKEGAMFSFVKLDNKKKLSIIFNIDTITIGIKNYEMSDNSYIDEIMQMYKKYFPNG